MTHPLNRRSVSQPPARLFRTGHITAIALALGVITSGSVVGYVLSVERYESPSALAVEHLPDEVVLASLLAEAGITPESLAVAGLAPSEASAIVSAAVGASEHRLIPYRAALENRHAAERDLTRLRRAGGASPQTLAAARERVQLAVQTVDGLAGLVGAASLATLDAGESRRLQAYHANAGRSLPLALRAKAWSPSEALGLTQALQQRTADLARGEAVDPEAAARIAQAERDADVTAAAGSLDERLAAIRAAFDQAVRGE